MSVQLRYFVPFKAVESVKAVDALKDKLLPIEGTAIDKYQRQQVAGAERRPRFCGFHLEGRSAPCNSCWNRPRLVV